MSLCVCTVHVVVYICAYSIARIIIFSRSVFVSAYYSCTSRLNPCLAMLIMYGLPQASKRTTAAALATTRCTVTPLPRRWTRRYTMCTLDGCSNYETENILYTYLCVQASHILLFISLHMHLLCLHPYMHTHTNLSLGSSHRGPGL